jgi:multiple sugar transport system ATP-binding protein
MASITLKNIVKTYEDGVTVIPGLDLEIRDKEFIILVGPSGCGKSTTLRMIAGLESITSGEMYIGDRLVNDVAPKDRDIAMVFQSYALYPHMTVYKNMAFALTLRKEPREEIDRKVREAARILDIEKYLNRKPRALSGGQRQRVALGRAMVRHPSVFLLDEPLSNLDAKLRTEMRAQISRLHRNLQTTFVYVTHDQTEAMTMADRIVVMKDGVIQQIDTPENLYAHPCNTFVAGFIGTPQINFLPATICVQGGRRCAHVGGHTLPLPERMQQVAALTDYIDREVVYALRPEHFYADRRHCENDHPAEISVKVELAEMMGSEIYVYTAVGQTDIIAKVAAGSKIVSGDKLKLFIDTERPHIFDKKSGLLICD